MSYIKNEHTYAYPDGEGGMVLNTDNVIDQGPGRNYRYLVRLDQSEFRELVREVVTRTAPEWVKPHMVNKAVDKFFEREKI